MSSTQLEQLRLVAVAIGTPLFVIALAALTVWIIREHRRRVVAVETAWAAFVPSRGFAFVPHQGSFRYDSRLGTTPRIHGAREELPFVVELVGYRRLEGTQVLVATPTSLSTAEMTSALLPRELEGDVAGAWTRLATVRPSARMTPWQRDGQQGVAVGWGGLEQDPAVLDVAIQLTVALGRRISATRSAYRAS